MKSSFRVIESVKKKEVDYRRIYRGAFIRTTQELINQQEYKKEIDADTLKRVLWYGIKSVCKTSFESMSEEELKLEHSAILYLDHALSTITLKELKELFPIDKVFDGHKYNTKDYYTTIEYLNDFAELEKLGDKTTELIWEYQNKDIFKYTFKKISLVSEIRRRDGQKGVMEEFMESQGVPMYRESTDLKGRRTLTNTQTGEQTIVKKALPRYLKIIK